MAHDPRIFLSAVTADFGLQKGETTSVIEQLAHIIGNQKCVCVNRYNLLQSPSTLPQKLHDEIAASDAVVHLVGPRYGFEPEDVEIGTSNAKDLWLPACRTWWQLGELPTRRSYTQMELDFALALKKPVYIFFVDWPNLKRRAKKQSEEDARLQDRHGKAIRARNQEYARAQSVATLAELTSRLPLAINQLIEQIALRDQALDRAQGAAETHGRRNFRLLLGTGATILLAVGAVAWNERKAHQANAAAHQQVMEKFDQRDAESKQQLSLLATGYNKLYKECFALKRKLSELSEEEYYTGLSRHSGLSLGEIKVLLETAKNSRDLGMQADALLLARENEPARTTYQAAQDLGLAAAAPLLAEVARNQRGMGIASFQQEDYRQAIADLRKALRTLDTLGDHTKEPVLRAQVESVLADALALLGSRAEPKEGNALLVDAVATYHAVLEIYSRKDFPGDWAATQNNLGSALCDQARREQGADSRRLFAEAVSAYQSALEVRTRKDFAHDWAATQNNLGAALIEQATRAQNEDALRLVAEAASACRAALEIYTAKEFPRQRSITQNNLGVALVKQASRAPEEASGALLIEAIATYRAALEISTKRLFPQDWAMTQTNLGAALYEQARRSEGADALRLIAEAVAAYRSALEVRTKQALPQPWAMTQNNLGISLYEQASRAGGKDTSRLYAEAVSAYRSALEIRTKEALPEDWAATQDNLGNALSDQASRAQGAEALRLFAEASAAYRSASEVRTKLEFPRDWAATQNNLGAALTEQAKRASPAESRRLLAEAVAAYRSAFEIYTREDLPQFWAATQNNLGAALYEQACRAEGEDSRRLFDEAIAAYRAVLEVRTKKAFPQDWAATQNNLGAALTDQASRADGDDALRRLIEAIAAYRSALEIYTRNEFPQPWAMTQKNLETAQLRFRLATFGKGGTRDNGRVFSLYEQWSIQHPNDRTSQPEIVELHLVTGRFTEAVARAQRAQKDLLADTGATRPDSLASHAAMRVIEVASLAAQNKITETRETLAAFQQELAQRETDFRLGWTWAGTQQFLQTSPEPGVAQHREWLLALVEAAKAENRDAISAKLRALPKL